MQFTAFFDETRFDIWLVGSTITKPILLVRWVFLCLSDLETRFSRTQKRGHCFFLQYVLSNGIMTLIKILFQNSRFLTTHEVFQSFHFL